jgi:hypothetical protein
MTTDIYAETIGLPIYGERVNLNNVNEGEIITYPAGKKQKYSVVEKIKLKTIKVTNLTLEVTNERVNFYKNSEIYPSTSNYLGVGRKIFKVTNANKL